MIARPSIRGWHLSKFVVSLSFYKAWEVTSSEGNSRKKLYRIPHERQHSRGDISCAPVFHVAAILSTAPFVPFSYCFRYTVFCRKVSNSATMKNVLRRRASIRSAAQKKFLAFPVDFVLPFPIFRRKIAWAKFPSITSRSK